MSKDIYLENKIIGVNQPVFIIAEAGVNHNGDLELAKKLVVEAKSCGADCIKFQTYKAESLVTREAPKALYQLHTTNPEESHYEMLKKLELKDEDFSELMRFCNEEDIIFLSTPYNFEDIDFLDSLGVPGFKVASGQATEPCFLEYVAKKGKPIFLSTGMCTLADVDDAVRVIRESGNNKIVVLQCTTNYPSSIDECNLKTIVNMKNAFNVLTGYSDHTTNDTATIVSVALEACIIEKHFTLDKKLPGPDQTTSANPTEFKKLVRKIRESEKARGNGIKIPTKKETENAKNMKRSIVAKYDLKAGSILSWDNLTLKRPELGFSAKQASILIGKKASEDILKDTFISIEMIK